MKRNIITNAFLSTTLLLLVFGRLNLSGAEHKSDQHAAWNYDGATGPKHWAELSGAFHLCKDGKRQSPIDLREKESFTVNGLPIKVSYRPDTVDEINNGHTIKEIIHNNSKVRYDGREYRLVQFHFHAHSEHTLNGKPFPLEIHFVHQDKTGHLLVIGVFLKQGKANAALEPVLRHLPRKTGDHEVDSMDEVDLKSFIPKNSAIFSYDGSLTTPPASEGVRWFVYKKPLTLSAKQLAQFQNIYDHNYRPIQPRNGRMVGLFRQRPKKN